MGGGAEIRIYGEGGETILVYLVIHKLTRKGLKAVKLYFQITLHAKMAMSDLQRYP